MKKYLFLPVAVLICTTVAYAQNNLKFAEALSDCSSYSESGVVNTEGMNVKSNKSIKGKKDTKCIYEEKVEFANNNFTITCLFSQDQIREIVDVMNAYNLVQSYTGENVDVSNYSAVQNNPVVKVWGKYLQNSSVCTFK